VEDGRDICNGGDVAKMQAVADRLDQIKKVAANKARREQVAADVVKRKAQRAHNKNHGMTESRVPYAKYHTR
jgi:hypothetical protein